jgi:Amidase
MLQCAGPGLRDSCALYATMALPWSGCHDLKVYRDLLVRSLERQLDGTGKRVQARQQLQCEFFRSHDALCEVLFFGGVSGDDLCVPGVAALVAAAAVVCGMNQDQILPFTLAGLVTVMPMTRTVRDAALLLDAISGHDPRDPGSLDLAPTRTAASLRDDCSGIVIGVEEEFFFSEVDAAIARCVWDGIQTLRQRGATVKAISIPNLKAHRVCPDGHRHIGN